MSHSTDELISVIVPVYNTGKEFLLECFESVRTQDYNNIELIIIDDGSTDEATENFCREYAENNENLVKYVRQKNAGVSVARQNGLSLSDGRCVMFLDSDDSLEQGSVKKMLEVLVKENADAVVGEDYVREGIDDVMVYEKLDILKALFDNVNASFGWALWGKLFDASAMKKYYKAYDDIYYGEDLLVNAEFFSHAQKAVVINEKVYNYRADNDLSATHQKITPKKLSLIRMWQLMWGIYSVHGLTDEAERIKANYYDSVRNGLIECECYHYDNYRKLSREYRTILKKNYSDIKSNKHVNAKYKYIIAIYFIWLFKAKKMLLRIKQ